MPSQQHSIIAKVRRYREEPERLLLVETDPLTVVITGFHGNHTVVRGGPGLICSCDRFRRGGGPCPHTLAVEQRFLDSDKSLRGEEIADFVSSATQQPVDDEPSTDGLLDHVLTVVWDVSANAPALMLTRGLVRAAGGQLTILSVRSGAGEAQPLVDTWQTLERLVTSTAWAGLSVRVSGRPDHLQPRRSIGLPATVVAVPIGTAGERERAAGRELVEQLHHSIPVPVLVVPDQAPAIERVRRVLAVVNDSPASLTVLAAAASFAQPIGAHVTVLHTGPRTAERARPTAPASGRQWVDITAERLRAMGISASGRATLGSAAHAIESVAESERADLVVVATPTGATRRDLGDVAERLLQTSTRPLLLVRRDARVADKFARGNT